MQSSLLLDIASTPPIPNVSNDKGLRLLTATIAPVASIPKNFKLH